MSCKKCHADAVMPQSGICLNCGFKNPPLVDKAKEETERKRKVQEAAEEAAQKMREQSKQSLQQALDCAQQGEASQAWSHWRKVNNQDSQVCIEKACVEAELWRLQEMPEKQLEVLEKLQGSLPFCEDNLQFYYDLACLFEEQGSPGKAFHLFKQFIDHQFHTFQDDILERYRKLKKSGVVADAGSGMVSGHCIYVGGMQQSVESLRGWVDQANRVPEYFRQSVLLNQDAFEDIDRVEQRYSGKLTLDDLVKAVKRALTDASLSDFKVENQSLSLQVNGPQGEGKPVGAMVLRPVRQTALSFAAGSLRLGVEVAFTGNAGVALQYYEFFTPARPEDAPGQQPDIRDFNDAICQTVLDIHNTKDLRRNALMNTLRDTVRKTIVSELERRARSGFQSFS